VRIAQTRFPKGHRKQIHEQVGGKLEGYKSRQPALIVILARGRGHGEREKGSGTLIPRKSDETAGETIRRHVERAAKK